MVAKARVAKAEALQPDGSEHPGNCLAEDWAWDIVNDLLRLDAIQNPDAELIRLCAQFDELTRESDIAFNAADEAGEDAITVDEPFRVKQRSLLKRIIPLRAQTQAGLEARAHMMMLWLGTFESEILEEYTDPEDHGHWHHIMLAMFIRDAIGHDLVPVSRAHDALFAGGVA